MDLILAMDLMKGRVVHGQKGERDSYQPLVWGLSPSTDPIEYVRFLRPRYLYIADLDRIRQEGSHDPAVLSCAGLVERTYLDRGCRSPEDYLHHPALVNVVGSETAGEDLSLYHGGYLSLDIKGGTVLPSGRDPLTMLSSMASLDFEGAILLNIGAVGTGAMPAEGLLRSWRASYPGALLYGGGVAGEQDLHLLNTLGYQGAIVSTALHRGRIPLTLLREGYLC
jgi:phosphoribosylformimino-5-aminoimidazole carboxamide ribotide isomerase